MNCPFHLNELLTMECNYVYINVSAFNSFPANQSYIKLAFSAPKSMGFFWCLKLWFPFLLFLDEWLNAEDVETARGMLEITTKAGQVTAGGNCG